MQWIVCWFLSGQWNMFHVYSISTRRNTFWKYDSVLYSVINILCCGWPIQVTIYRYQYGPDTKLLFLSTPIPIITNMYTVHTALQLSMCLNMYITHYALTYTKHMHLLNIHCVWNAAIWSRVIIKFSSSCMVTKI